MVKRKAEELIPLGKTYSEDWAVPPIVEHEGRTYSLVYVEQQNLDWDECAERNGRNVEDRVTPEYRGLYKKEE